MSNPRNKIKLKKVMARRTKRNLKTSQNAAGRRRHKAFLNDKRGMDKKRAEAAQGAFR